MRSAAPEAEHPDEFYEFTESDLHRVQVGLAKRAREEPAHLMTQQVRVRAQVWDLRW
jgi:hypothetical protein